VSFGGLLGVLGSGIAGEYSDRAVAVWAAASAVMVICFGLAIWAGACEVRLRGIDAGFIRRGVAASVLTLVAAMATVPIVAAGFGGSGLPVVGDLFALAFLASVVGINRQIWQRLRGQPE